MKTSCGDREVTEADYALTKLAHEDYNKEQPEEQTIIRAKNSRILFFIDFPWDWQQTVEEIFLRNASPKYFGEKVGPGIRRFGTRPGEQVPPKHRYAWELDIKMNRALCGKNEWTPELTEKYSQLITILTEIPPIPRGIYLYLAIRKLDTERQRRFRVGERITECGFGPKYYLLQEAISYVQMSPMRNVLAIWYPRGHKILKYPSCLELYLDTDCLNFPGEVIEIERDGGLIDQRGMPTVEGTRNCHIYYCKFAGFAK